MKKLIELLTNDNKIKLLISDITNLETDIKNEFEGSPQLKWTILEYQQYLQKVIIKEAKKLKISSSNIDILINKALLKFSSIFPPSIGDYRIKENWIDHRSAAVITLQNSGIKQMIKVKSLPLLREIIQNANSDISNNKNILKTMTLFEFEIIDLVKRAILSFFGGLENINDLKLLDSRYNKALPNNIEYRFFKINCIDKNKLSLINHLISYWNNELLIYERYINKNLLDFQNINVKVNWGFGFEELQYYENHWIIDGAFVINYNNKEKKFINRVISQVIKQINTKLENDEFDLILEKIWNNKVLWNIKQYEALVNSISRKYFKLTSFKTDFKNTIKKLNNDNKFGIILNDKVIKELFEIVGMQLQLVSILD